MADPSRSFERFSPAKRPTVTSSGSIEMHAETDIPCKSTSVPIEIFNTYGSLSNARLLSHYGFMIEANEHDRLTWSSFVHLLEHLEITLSEDRMATLATTLVGVCIEQLYIDCEGDLSSSLWTCIAMCSAAACTATNKITTEMARILSRDIEALCCGESPSSLAETHLSVFAETIRLAQHLVSRRLRGIAHSEMPIEELFIKLDRTPLDNVSVRLAIRANMQDRLCLRACQAQLTELLKCIES